MSLAYVEEHPGVRPTCQLWGYCQNVIENVVKFIALLSLCKDPEEKYLIFQYQAKSTILIKI